MKKTTTARNSTTSQTVRLNKFISDSGITSRRKADEIIAEGRVTINGKKVFELGIKVSPKTDNVLVDGKPVRAAAEKVYFKFHKPKSVLTTTDDPLNRTTVQDFVENFPVRVFPVGRLDWDSEGLLLMTNDGDLAQEITHPKHEITKTYIVKVDGQPPQEKLDKLLKGVTIMGGKVAAKHIEKIKRPDGSEKYDWLKIVITEGKNRQIRQMFEKIGFDVLKLQRVAIGRLKLGNLQKGEFEVLGPDQLLKIFQPDLPEEQKRKMKSKYEGHKRSEKSKRLSRKVKPAAFKEN